MTLPTRICTVAALLVVAPAQYARAKPRCKGAWLAKKAKHPRHGALVLHCSKTTRPRCGKGSICGAFHTEEWWELFDKPSGQSVARRSASHRDGFGVSKDHLFILPEHRRHVDVLEAGALTKYVASKRSKGMRRLRASQVKIETYDPVHNCKWRSKHARQRRFIDVGWAADGTLRVVVGYCVRYLVVSYNPKTGALVRDGDWRRKKPRRTPARR